MIGAQKNGVLCSYNLKGAFIKKYSNSFRQGVKLKGLNK